MEVGVLREEKRLEIRVSGEANPEEIVGLAFVPVGAGKHAGNRRQFRVGAGKAGADDPPSTAPAPAVKPAVKAGRNDPCPCGSGTKFIKCCGR